MYYYRTKVFLFYGMIDKGTKPLSEREGFLVL